MQHADMYDGGGHGKWISTLQQQLVLLSFLRGGVCNELEVLKEYQVLKYIPFHTVEVSILMSPFFYSINTFSSFEVA